MTITARIVAIALTTVVGVAGMKVVPAAQDYPDDQDLPITHVLL